MCTLPANVFKVNVFICVCWNFLTPYLTYITLILFFRELIRKVALPFQWWPYFSLIRLHYITNFKVYVRNLETYLHHFSEINVENLRTLYLNKIRFHSHLNTNLWTNFSEMWQAHFACEQFRYNCSPECHNKEDVGDSNLRCKIN